MAVNEKRRKVKYKVGQVVAVRVKPATYLRITMVQMHNDCEPGYWFGGVGMSYLRGAISYWQSQLRPLTKREKGA